MSAFQRRLKKSSVKWLGAENVTFVDGWTKRHNGRWRYGNGNNPVMAIAHHTAGGDSKDPNGNPGWFSMSSTEAQEFLTLMR